MSDMVVQFYGVRGTLPVPGKKAVRYGGNTNCVTLTIEDRHFFIFDAGTGFKALSDQLMQQKKKHINAKIFITHPHYDHINGIPYFAPLYEEGNSFEFLGPNHDSLTIENLISKQMDSIYFPVTVKEFLSKIKFRSLNEGTFDVDGVKVRAMYLNHPGQCLGYRVEYHNKSFCYITDNELYLKDSAFYKESDESRITAFIKNADIVVMDATYTDEEYTQKVGWGHACVSRVIDVCDNAQVKLLCLHHHSPNQLDKDIQEKLKIATALLKAKHSKTKCIAPCEGEILTI